MDIIKKVEIFTDGACSGNPGPGGYGVILRFGEHTKELSGGEHETTNNRMELTGVITGLSALKEPCEVTLTTDSKYVVDSITKGWVYGWQKKGWIKSDKKPALNVDLWKQLLPLLENIKLILSGSKDMPDIRKMKDAISWQLFSVILTHKKEGKFNGKKICVCGQCRYNKGFKTCT